MTGEILARLAKRKVEISSPCILHQKCRQRVQILNNCNGSIGTFYAKYNWMVTKVLYTHGNIVAEITSSREFNFGL